MGGAKRFSVSVVFVMSAVALGAASPSLAADPIFTKAPPVGAITAIDWTGFYGGLHAGVGRVQFRGTYQDQLDTGPFSTSGVEFFGGGQLGYNWQTGRSVYGLEFDGSWGSRPGFKAAGGAADVDGPDFVRTEARALASARVRAGIAVNNAMLFSSFGVGYADAKFTITGDTPSPASVSLSAVGLVTGFGMEWMFGPNWSARIEALQYNLGKKKSLFGLTTDSSVRTTDFVKIDDIQVVRVAMNYRWGGAAPGANMSAPAANFAGVYAGLHGGYGISRITGTFNDFNDYGGFDFDPKGFLGGAHAGYNAQNGAWVYGFEIDGTWAGMKNDRTIASPVPGLTNVVSDKLETNALASARARFGAVVDNKLFFFTAGIGYVQSEYNVTDTDGVTTVSATKKFSSWGPVVGSGVEWAFAPNWLFRFEGLTYLFDHKVSIATLIPTAGPGGTVSDATDFIKQSTVSVVRVGLTYRR
jgi:outer membrane immunogenic protein